MGKWKCKKCGDCCKHISIYAPNIGWEEEAYIEAHGCKYMNGHLIIPAKCRYLTSQGLCAIHKNKFSMCKKYGEKECINGKITKKA